MIVIAGQARQKEKTDKNTTAEEEEEADFNRLNGLLYKTVFFNRIGLEHH